MKPIETPETNLTYSLPGGTRENDLPVFRARPGLVLSERELNDDERAAIARGGRIELGVYAEPIPPVHVAVVERGQDGELAYVDAQAPALTDRPAG